MSLKSSSENINNILFIKLTEGAENVVTAFAKVSPKSVCFSTIGVCITCGKRMSSTQCRRECLFRQRSSDDVPDVCPEGLWSEAGELLLEGHSCQMAFIISDASLCHSESYHLLTS